MLLVLVVQFLVVSLEVVILPGKRESVTGYPLLWTEKKPDLWWINPG